MKVVILAGGLGTRISEETDLKPKPMIEIGGKPILWHILKTYSTHGINDFVICLGYKGYVIKEYFSNYSLHSADVTFDIRKNEFEFHEPSIEPWRITLVDTGAETMTGGRLKRVKPFLNDEPFCFTYGDGVGDVDISALIKFHNSHGRRATVTGVRLPSRYGHLNLEGDFVTGFTEKPEDQTNLINGGFFVLSPEVIDHIEGDDTVWEGKPLEKLALDQQLMVYRHFGFWHAMDTVRDRQQLEEIWSSGEAPWKTWT